MHQKDSLGFSKKIGIVSVPGFCFGVCISEVSLVSLEEFKKYLQKSDALFGNISQKKSSYILASPSAVYVAKWSYIFGKDLVTYDYDFLEPNYLKKFVVKVKK